MLTERMSRPRERVIAGVCAGFADHTGVPVAAVRAGIAALTLVGGSGALLYAWLWATTPTEIAREPRRRDLALARPGQRAQRQAVQHTDATASAAQTPHAAHAPVGTETAASTGTNRRRARLRESPAGSAAAADTETTATTASTHDSGIASGGWTASVGFSAILVGAALVVIGAFLVAERLGLDVPVAVIVPLVVIGAGVALAWQQVSELIPGATRPAARPYANVVGAIGLVITGILLIFANSSHPNIWTMFAAAFAALLAVLIALAPWLIRLSRDLTDERAARARESERETIAAHLHDSVLQTLAVIQQKSPAHSDVSRIARAQERELREWLFAETLGDPTATVHDIVTELKTHAAKLEADYPVTFEVVSVGTGGSGEHESSGHLVPALTLAAREAMTNAAKHAGGAVSVFIERGPERCRVDVIDRGPGFALETIPDDRHGVRDSIIGRLRTAGGDAVFTAGPGGVGTSVTLQSRAAAPEASAEPARTAQQQTSTESSTS